MTTTKKQRPLPRIDPPAFLDDFKHDSAKAKTLRSEWSKHIRRWSESALVGNPWTRVRDENREFYFSLLDTPVAPGAKVAKIAWRAFPNRINTLFPNSGDAEKWSMADNGPPPVNGAPYGPTGPRGWQDEYCEWSVQSKDGKIVRVDFTCENNEYWTTLWRVDPDRVVALYKGLLPPSLAAQVKKEDLYLLFHDNPVIERETGRPAYNPLNKWNRTTTGGAIHLVSPPNTLYAEIELAAAATILREKDGQPVTDEAALIGCSQYGSAGRNSDPHIGAQVNELVRESHVRVSLMNPVGLYIQDPDFSSFELPPNAPPGKKPSDYWKLLRGRTGLGLHATFEVPEADGFTVGDITIDGVPIAFGAQIAQTFDIALSGIAATATKAPGPLACLGKRAPLLPTVDAFNDLNLLEANSGELEGSSLRTVRIEQGTTVANLAMRVGNGADLAVEVMFSGSGVTPRVQERVPNDGGDGVVLLLTIAVDSSAPLGDRSILLRNPGAAVGPAAPGQLEVVAPGTLPKPPDVGRLVVAEEFGEIARRIGAQQHDRSRGRSLDDTKECCPGDGTGSSAG